MHHPPSEELKNLLPTHWINARAAAAESILHIEIEDTIVA
jgi:hypothetical protein